jgi:methylmalonyl-CoA/ethylmalonyl-CoA epimerase
MQYKRKKGLHVKQVAHIGFVVRDLDHVVSDWSSKFGIGPWTFLNTPEMKVGSAFVGSVQFEVFQPLETEKPDPGTTHELITNFLNIWGDGIHHIGFAFEDVKEETSKLEAQGVRSLIKNSTGLMSYLESSLNGVIFELASNIFFEEVRKTGLGNEILERVDKRLTEKYQSP